MINNLHLPLAGETILLLCKQCHHIFYGPNPSGIKIPTLVISAKKAKCSKCGSKKIVPHPFIFY